MGNEKGADAGGREGGAEAKGPDPSPAACLNERGQLELFGDDGRAWHSQGESMFRIRVMDVRSLDPCPLRTMRPSVNASAQPIRRPVRNSQRTVRASRSKMEIAREGHQGQHQ